MSHCKFMGEVYHTVPGCQFISYQHSVTYLVPIDLWFLDVLTCEKLLVFHLCHLLILKDALIGTFPRSGKNLSPAMDQNVKVFLSGQFHFTANMF